MRWRALLREPLLHFCIAGALLFALFGQQGDTVEPVSLSAAGVAVLVGDFERMTGRVPTAAEREQLIEEQYRSEVLFREALRQRLPATDPALREPIVERMQMQVTGSLPEPTAAQLVDYYAANIERYYREATITCRQYFLREAPADTEALRQALERGQAPPGDLAPQGSEFPDYGISMLRGLFGQPVLEALQGAEFGEWIGPFESRDGWHYFAVASRRAPELLPFAAVREQVAADFLAAELDRRVAVFVEAQKARYPLQLEDD